MALSASSADALSSIGPVVDGEATTVCSMSAAQLAASPLLPHVANVVNKAFRFLEVLHPELNLPPVDRYPDGETLCRDLQDDPETFLVAISMRETVIATCSCRLYRGPTPEDTKPWVRQTAVAPNFLEWELRLLAVDPHLHRRGLAAHIMRLIEAEAIRRSSAILACGPQPQSHGIKMTLSTLKEANETFYLNRGYVWESDKPCGDEFNFNVAFMYKILVDTPLTSDQR